MKDKNRQSNLIGCLPDATSPLRLIFDPKKYRFGHSYLSRASSSVPLYGCSLDQATRWQMFGSISCLSRLCLLFFSEAHKSSDLTPSACHCSPMISVAVEGDKCDLCKANKQLQQDIDHLRKEIETVKNRSSQIQPGKLQLLLYRFFLLRSVNVALYRYRKR